MTTKIMSNYTVYISAHFAIEVNGDSEEDAASNAYDELNSSISSAGLEADIEIVEVDCNE